MQTDNLIPLTPEEEQAKLEAEAIFERLFAERCPEATPKPAKITPRKDIINPQLDEVVRRDLAALPTRRLPDEQFQDFRKALKRKGAKIGMLEHIVGFGREGTGDSYSLGIVVFLPPKGRKQKYVGPAINHPKATVLWRHDLSLSPHSRHHAVVQGIKQDRWAIRHHTESIDTIIEIERDRVMALTAASNAVIIECRSDQVWHNESARLRQQDIAERMRNPVTESLARSVNRRYRSRDEAYEAEDPHYYLVRDSEEEEYWQMVDLSEDWYVPIDYTAMIEAMSWSDRQAGRG